MFEAHVSLLEVGEVLLGIQTSYSAGGSINVTLGWRRLRDTFVDQMASISLAIVNSTMIAATALLPVNCWNGSSKRVGGFFLLQIFGVAVDAARFFDGRDATTHVCCASREFVI